LSLVVSGKACDVATNVATMFSHGAEMVFEWDPAKNKINIQKHGFDFADAKKMFAGSPLLVGSDTAADYAEERWIGIGMIKDIVAVVIFTQSSPKVIRIISLRKATKNEQANYYKSTFSD
jgi:uncharacterized DUF497 family protein